MPFQVAPIPYFQLRKGAPFWPREPSRGSIQPATFAVGAKYTEFYCDPVNGNNLNSGSDPNATAKYTSNAGNWVQGTRVFTVTDGSTPGLNCNVGDFASVYVTAGAVDGVFVARIIAVDLVANGTITLASGSGFVGSSPATASGTMTLKVGGAWKGPVAGDGWPWNNTTFTGTNVLTDAAGDPCRVNLKNNGNYVWTTNMTNTWGGILQGYKDIPGDGGRAQFINQTQSNTWQWSTQPVVFIDIEFSTAAGVSLNNDMIQLNIGGCSMTRCAVRDGRTNGVLITSGNFFTFFECEFSGCNVSNTANRAGVNSNASTQFAIFYNCYFHDNIGSADGAQYGGAAAGSWYFFNCIFDSNGGCGYRNNSAQASGNLFFNCDFYNNGSDGISLLVAGNGPTIYNCNFIKNRGRPINVAAATYIGFIYSCGYGTGTQANGLPNAVGDIVEVGRVMYPPNVTPWVSPATGDFRVILPQALGAGRGFFLQTGFGKTGTVGAPDIGAAQHLSTAVAPGWGDQIVTLPDAYVNHAYVVDWLFDEPVTLSLQAGSLPPGLGLSTVSSTEAHVTGTPTGVVGTSYTFTLRATVPAGGFADSIFTITVRADPAAGAGTGGVSGG